MKSLFDKKKIDSVKASDTREVKLYELSMNYVLQEAQLLWQSSQLFLVANALLVGFISGIEDNKIIIVLLSLIGIAVSFLWLLSYTRTLNYYRFRIDQAKQREPEGWMLFNGDGNAFSKGESIIINGSRHTFGIGKLSNLIIVRILVSLFIGLYTLLLLSFFHIFGVPDFF